MQPDKDGALASPEHWEAFHSGRSPRLRLPSPLVISTRNLHHLLRRHVRPGMRVLEIGFAPGKQLAYVAKVLRATVVGVDYSENGVRIARRLFETLALDGRLLCEDIFATSATDASFDFVYSVGVIEHFSDPAPIVRRHVDLLRSGGTALILVPNYCGPYGTAQRYFDADNLLIHNLGIMHRAALQALAPKDLVASARAYRCGRLDPSQVSFGRRWSPLAARSVSLFLTAVGHLQPFEIGSLCPWFALEMRRA